jgi:phospholipase/carboxylesterase
VRQRANELADFVTNARTRYGFASPIPLGYSNGANIAAAMLLLRPSELAGATLLRAMPPLANPRPVKLEGVPVLIVSGARDPIIQPESVAKLASLLERYGAAVEHRVLPAGGPWRGAMSRAYVTAGVDDDAIIAFLMFCLEIYQAEQRRKRKLH